MKLLLENWRKYIAEDWRDTSWEDDGEKVTIGAVAAHLREIGSKTVDIVPSEVRNQVLKNRDNDHLPVGPGITSQKRVDDADLSFPIIAAMEGGKYISVLDGNHRLQKAVEQDKPLKAKILDLDNPETPEVFKKMFGGAE